VTLWWESQSGIDAGQQCVLVYVSDLIPLRPDCIRIGKFLIP
jgi:hypothetical protein